MQTTLLTTQTQKKLDEVPNKFPGCKSLHSSSKMTTVPDAMAAAFSILDVVLRFIRST